MLELTTMLEEEKTNTLSEEVINADTPLVSLVEVTNLPSGFKGYPEGTKISYMPLTLGELEALNSGTMDVLRGIALLLKSIKCNTLEPYELYYWDVMYIGIQRKLMAFGDTRGVLYNACPSCGEIHSYEFDYTELEFEQISAPELPIITNIGGQELEFSPITIKDFLDIDTDKGEVEAYARMVKNVPYEIAYNLLENCHGKDMKKVNYINKQLAYGIKPFELVCNSIIEDGKEKSKKGTCGETVYMEVRSPFEVVFPENSNDDDIELEIRYGKK